MSTPPTRPTRHGNRWDIRNDDGSLILVILFTVIMTALVLVATATAITGLTKTRNSRDYAIAFQAADTAFASAVIQANLGVFTPTAQSPQSSPVTPLGPVTWQWTATRVTPRTWTIAVEAKGARMSRHFEATLKGTQVSRGRLSTSADTLRYIADKSENFENGFFGIDSVTMTGAPDLDGFNGATGTVGSNGTLALGAASVDHLNEWNWSSDTGRCAGTACSTADTSRIAQSANFAYTDMTTACATPTGGDWVSSSNTALVADGRCYNSIRFVAGSNYNLPVNGLVYSKNAVIVDPGVQVLTAGNYVTAPANRLRIATLGGFTQGVGSKISLAVYAPVGNCQITAATNNLYQTVFLGAATCKTFKVDGNARLRYDGGLLLVDSSTGSGTYVWSMFDYESID